MQNANRTSKSPAQNGGPYGRESSAHRFRLTGFLRTAKMLHRHFGAGVQVRSGDVAGEKLVVSLCADHGAVVAAVGRAAGGKIPARASRTRFRACGAAGHWRKRRPQWRAFSRPCRRAAARKLRVRQSTTALRYEAARSGTLRVSPRCSALWIRLMAFVFRPEKLKSYGAPSTEGRGSR